MKFVLKKGYDVTMPELPNSSAPPCNGTILAICIKPSYDKFYNSDLVSSCFKYCPNECESVFFDLELSHSSFPTPFYTNLLAAYWYLHPNEARDFSTAARITGSVLAVNVYYDDIAYEVVEEVAATTKEQFIGNIGGLVGLCAGLSFLSFVEILEIAYYVSYIIFKRNT